MTTSDSKNLIRRLAISGFNKLRGKIKAARHFCADTDFRSVIFLKLLNPKNVHQTTALTALNRYPRIFAACRDYFGGKRDLNILSFGCSTGEEVLTLREYFPDARITGAEINRRSLAVCRNLQTDDKISFVYSEFSELQKCGRFDAIFCMAVLQRTPHHIAEKKIRSLKKIYPFEKFERQIVELDKLLVPHGLLVIKFAQYSFNDTSVAAKYQALSNQPPPNGDGALLFDKNSELIGDSQPQNQIFIKMRE